MLSVYPESPYFFFNDTATTEIYTLSLHDALPISRKEEQLAFVRERILDATVATCAKKGIEGVTMADIAAAAGYSAPTLYQDRKSTRLNSSHVEISYAVFCLKKKKERKMHQTDRAT